MNLLYLLAGMACGALIALCAVAAVITHKVKQYGKSVDRDARRN